MFRPTRRNRTKFIDVITTNKTYFFRTPRIWKYLQETYLPSWYLENRTKEFVAWSAATSSGEEANSIGILCQAFQDANPGFRYQVIGTDISKQMVSLCESGQYSGGSIRSFQESNAQWFSKYMIASGSDCFKAAPKIQRQMRFAQHNLFLPLKKAANFDLVLLRNVLIYFDSHDQEAVLSNIYPRLKKSGLLVIGESESLSNIKCRFEKESTYIYKPLHSELVQHAL